MVEEHIVVSKHLKAAEALRFHTVVHTDEELVATPVTSEKIEVTRVPLDRWVDAAVPERQEDDTRIVTLHAEVVVTETRIKAIEEVRIPSGATPAKPPSASRCGGKRRSWSESPHLPQAPPSRTERPVLGPLGFTPTNQQAWSLNS